MNALLRYIVSFPAPGGYDFRTKLDFHGSIRVTPEDAVKYFDDQGLTGGRFEGREWDKWAWPGGYPIYYVCTDGEIMCADCCNANIKMTGDPDAESEWHIALSDINYEDNDMFCCSCNEKIESAYGDEDSCDRDEEAYQQELESREEP